MVSRQELERERATLLSGGDLVPYVDIKELDYELEMPDTFTNTCLDVAHGMALIDDERYITVY